MMELWTLTGESVDYGAGAHNERRRDEKVIGEEHVEEPAKTDASIPFIVRRCHRVEISQCSIRRALHRSGCRSSRYGAGLHMTTHTKWAALPQR